MPPVSLMRPCVLLCLDVDVSLRVLVTCNRRIQLYIYIYISYIRIYIYISYLYTIYNYAMKISLVKWQFSLCGSEQRYYCVLLRVINSRLMSYADSGGQLPGPSIWECGTVRPSGSADRSVHLGVLPGHGPWECCQTGQA